MCEKREKVRESHYSSEKQVQLDRDETESKHGACLNPDNNPSHTPSIFVSSRRRCPSGCQLLQSFKIMDYSLLVGIHRLEQGGEEVPVAVPEQKRVPSQKPLYCTAMEAIQGEAQGQYADQCHDQ